MGLVAYFHIMFFAAARFLQYPTEVFATFLRKLTTLGFLVFFWSIVAKSSGLNETTQSLVAYFLLADGISTLIMAYTFDFGKYVRHAVRDGNIANYFIKPVRIIPYIYFTVLGDNAVINVVSIGSIILGITLLESLSLFSFFIFGVCFINALFISLAFNLLEANLSFIMTETSGVKNAIRHVVRLFSGLVIPISFFPEPLRQIALLSPFPAMVYGPTQALKESTFTIEVQLLVVTGLFWSILLMGLMLLLWRKLTRQFEAVGL